MPVVRLVRLWCALLSLACTAARDDGDTSVPAPEATRDSLRDDYGRVLDTTRNACRIVSLNPTTTEILFALGAGRRLVGRTRWDMAPDSTRLVPDLGDGLRPNVEAVLAAHPDLVVLYASADNRPAERRFREAGVRVIGLKIDRIADFHRAVRLLGSEIGDTTRARILSDSVAAVLDAVQQATRGLPRPSVFWYVWDSPLITIGGASYMNELVEIAGGRNIYAASTDVSPQISLEDLLARDPDVILVAPKGAASIRADPAWRGLTAVRGGRVLVVDTTLVGSPSVRLGAAARSLARLLHPDRAP